MLLIERRADDLVQKAKSELAALDGPEPPPHDSTHKKNELRSMMTRIRAPMDTKARAGAYEVGNDTFAEDPNHLMSTDGDVEMGNVLPRTQTTIRADLTHELRDLAMWGASEMKAYDAYAKDTTMKYKRALEKRAKSSISAPGSASGVQPKSILSNRHVGSPVDREAMRMASLNTAYGDGARGWNK